MQPAHSLFYALLGVELSRLSPCFEHVYILAPDESPMLEHITTASAKTFVVFDELHEPLREAYQKNQSVLVVLDGELNFRSDIVELLQSLAANLNRSSRIAVILHNPYLRLFGLLSRALGRARGPTLTTFLTRQSLANLLTLSGLEMIRLRPVGYLPWKAYGIGSLINALLPALPGLRWFSNRSIAILRPRAPDAIPRSVSLIVPARNEAGNIAPLVHELSCFSDIVTEVVFVEGHSRDQTWERILEAQRSAPISIVALQQSGIGKRNAVERGIEHATHELIAIVDADHTVHVREVRQLVQAFLDGYGDLINGNRLIYAMESEAMRFLNLLGNLFFAKLLSYTTETPLGDTLCGTKVFLRQDYYRMRRWREFVAKGNGSVPTDPFGDFDLLLPAASLGLGIFEIPVHYRARSYGTTNINRIEDGLSLLKVSWFSFKHLRCGPWL